MRRSQRWGPAALILLSAVCIACALTAVGLLNRLPWGRLLAIAILSVNMIGDAVAAIVRADPQTLVGLPITGYYHRVPHCNDRYGVGSALAAVKLLARRAARLAPFDLGKFPISNIFRPPQVVGRSALVRSAAGAARARRAGPPCSVFARNRELSAPHSLRARPIAHTWPLPFRAGGGVQLS